MMRLIVASLASMITIAVAGRAEEATEVAASVATAPGSDVRESATRVRIAIDVHGEIFAPAGRDAPPLRRPIEMEARFDFVETPIAGEGPPVVERRYTDATAELRIDGAARRSALAADARTLRVALRGTTPSPYLPQAFLSREEVDLLDTPFDPLLIDALRPSAAVDRGDGWDVAADAVAGLLGIDTVESGGIRAVLAEIDGDRGTVKLSGIVDGAADGVPTHVTIDGACTAAVAVDANGRVSIHGHVATLSLVLRERREASHVAPGFDVEARLSIARTPTDASVIGQSAVAADDAESPATARRHGEGRPGLVWHHDSAGRYDLVHDDRWRMIEDGPDGLVMRFVDRGALVAQCSIMALPRVASRTPPTIAEVERDLERSLAGQFGRIEHSSEAVRSDGVRLVRVVAAGRVEGRPFRWIHNVLADEAGHRLAASCMFEEALAKRFGSADRELVDGISFPAVPGDSGPETAGASATPDDREARVPRESRTP